MNSSLKKRKDEKYFLKDIQLLKPGLNTITIKEFPGTIEQKHNYRIND